MLSRKGLPLYSTPELSLTTTGLPNATLKKSDGDFFLAGGAEVLILVVFSVWGEEAQMLHKDGIQPFRLRRHIRGEFNSKKRPLRRCSRAALTRSGTLRNVPIPHLAVEGWLFEFGANKEEAQGSAKACCKYQWYEKRCVGFFWGGSGIAHVLTVVVPN